MNWSSWGEFFAMGGYATYVWGSYLVTFVIMALEIVLVRQHGRNTRDKIVKSIKRNTKQ